MDGENPARQDETRDSTSEAPGQPWLDEADGLAGGCIQENVGVGFIEQN